jgi:NAD(P)H dehydrogenase (quinone)
MIFSEGPSVYPAWPSGESGGQAVILVTGATGSIGRHLVTRLRQWRVPFKALVRSQEKGRDLGCDFPVGDFDDPGSVSRALRGVDRLFLNAGGAVPVDGDQPMIRQQEAAIDAAVAAGVSQVVKVSVLGARAGGRLATGAHWRIEERLRASGLAWTVLRPSGFMQNFLTGAGSLTIDGRLIDGYGGGAVAYIDCHDIAACAAALLTGPGRPAETFALTGPAPLTGTDITRKLSAALGRTVGQVTLTPGELAAMLKARGLPAGFADDVAALAGEVADGSLAATTPAVRDLTGRAPRTFDQFINANRAALEAAFGGRLHGR